MFSHVYVGVTDFDRALAFYTPLMGLLGIQPRFCERERPWAGWQSAPEPRPHPMKRRNAQPLRQSVKPSRSLSSM